ARAGISECIVVVARRHQAPLRQCDCNTGGIAGDPTTSPLLSSKSRRSRSTRWVENKVAWISCHQQTTNYRFHIGLNDVYLARDSDSIGPIVSKAFDWVVIEEQFVSQSVLSRIETGCLRKGLHSFTIRLPAFPRCGRIGFPSPLEVKDA